MNPNEPKMVNEKLAKEMRTALTSTAEGKMKDAMETGMPVDKEFFHGVNTAMLSNTLEGKEYPVIMLGVANKIVEGQRKAMVEKYREDAHKMWEELFGTYPPPWKIDANDKAEPFPFVETGLDQFLKAAIEVYEHRIKELDKLNCRAAAWTFVNNGVFLLVSGSMTLPIVMAGIAWAIWNGEEEILLNENHHDAKRFWNKYLNEVECPYGL